MILIQSSNEDITTNNVIDWLVYYERPFVRINENDIVELDYLNLGIDDWFAPLLIGQFYLVVNIINFFNIDL